MPRPAPMLSQMATTDSNTQFSNDASSKMEQTADSPPKTGNFNEGHLTINSDSTTPPLTPNRVIIPRTKTEKFITRVSRSEGMVQDQKFRCYRCSFVLDEQNKCIDDECGADSTRVVDWVRQLPENYENSGKRNLDEPGNSEGKTFRKYRKRPVKFAVGDESL